MTFSLFTPPSQPATAPVKPTTQKRSSVGRMLKCECQQCGYIIRTTRTWLDNVGPPLCPCNHQPMKEEIK